MDKAQIRREIETCENRIRELRQMENKTTKKKEDLQQAKKTVVKQREDFGTTIYNKKKRLTASAIPVGNVSIQNYIKTWGGMHTMSHGTNDVSKINSTFIELEEKIIQSITKCENELTEIREEIQRQQERIDDLRQELRVWEENHV